jgi:hypothetical protein
MAKTLRKRVVAKKAKRRKRAVDLFHLRLRGKLRGTEAVWVEQRTVAAELGHVKDYPIPEDKRWIDG